MNHEIIRKCTVFYSSNKGNCIKKFQLNKGKPSVILRKCTKSIDALCYHLLNFFVSFRFFKSSFIKINRHSKDILNFKQKKEPSKIEIFYYKISFDIPNCNKNGADKSNAFQLPGIACGSPRN